jgi:hypothetical protein
MAGHVACHRCPPSMDRRPRPKTRRTAPPGAHRRPANRAPRNPALRPHHPRRPTAPLGHDRSIHLAGIKERLGARPKPRRSTGNAFDGLRSRGATEPHGLSRCVGGSPVELGGQNANAGGLGACVNSAVPDSQDEVRLPDRQRTGKMDGVGTPRRRAVLPAGQRDARQRK